MTKEQFINRMAKNGKINKVTALEYTNLFMDTLTECIKEDGKVMFYGFGKFEKRTMKEKMGRNPQNGKQYPIPEHNSVKFKAGESLLKEVN